MAGVLRLTFLGQLQISRNGDPVTGFVSGKAQALLCYLAVSGRSHARPALAGLLWGEMAEADARASLRVALHNLRRVVGGHLVITRETVAFNQEPQYWLDVEAFEANIQNPEDDPDRLREAAALYRGDFLEGFYVRDAPAFEEWMLGQRERLRQLALQALHMLAAHYTARREYVVGIDYTARLLALEPWREAAHRQMMILLAHSGQRSAALAQYETCRRVLAEELGVAPDAETSALYERIRAATDVPPHNLPAQTTPFLGREEELAAIATRLRDPACRLLTLAGPGGSGKTRLALEAAADQIGAFLHGVYFVPLASVSHVMSTSTEFVLSPSASLRRTANSAEPSLELLVGAAADALHFVFPGSETPKVQLLNYLREKEMLLVLDNFEHLLRPRPPSVPPDPSTSLRTGFGGEAGGAGFGEEEGGATGLLAEILQRAPAVKFLVTSRERLNLQEEWLFEVHGLRYPTADTTADDRRPTAEGGAAVGGQRSAVVESYSAVQLFLQRARRVHGGFSLAEAEQPWAARICQLVEGLPLGIELAAAWVRVLSCAEIAAEIELGLDFLTTSLRDVPERHRSLRAVFEHSWALLSDEEQRVFRRMSVFRGGFQRAAVEAVLGDAARHSPLVTLTALVDKFLLRSTPAGRYEIHELLRQFAAERLLEFPEEQESTQTLHCHYYAAFLEQREAHLKGEQQQQALEEIAAEIENVRAGWRWAAAQRDIEAIRKFAAGLFRFYEIRGRYQEGEEAFRRAIESLSEERSATQAGPQSKIALGQLLARRAGLLYRLGKYERAQELLRGSLPLLRAHDAQSEVAFALNYLGNVVSTLGERQPARRYYQESLSIYQQLGDRWGIALLLNNLGTVAHDLGAYEAAKGHYQESLAAHQYLGDRWGRALALRNLGTVTQALGEHTQAKRLYRESLAVSRQIGDQFGIAVCLLGLGDVEYSLGAYQEARGYLQESLVIRRAIGDRWGTSIALDNLGNVARRLGEHPAAGGHYRKALKTALDIQALPVALDVLIGIALLLTSAGESERACELLALARSHPASDKYIQERAQRHLTELEPQLPPEAAAATWKRGAASALEQVAAEILEDVVLP